MNSLFCRNIFNKHMLLVVSRKYRMYYKVNLFCGCHTVLDNSISGSDKTMTLLRSGFSEESLEKLRKHKTIISKINIEKLESTINSLMKCQFGESNLIDLVEKHPYILSINSPVIESHFNYLSSRFKKVSIFRVFLNSPEVFDDKVESLERKLNYLKDRMGVSYVEIGKIGALSYSLDYIKERHIFLQRAGIFKLINEKHRLLVKNSNPSLDYILNTSPVEFSRKVAGLSLFEFETFQQMYSKEDDDNEEDENT